VSGIQKGKIDENKVLKQMSGSEESKGEDEPRQQKGSIPFLEETNEVAGENVSAFLSPFFV